jgi:hypothetical protein
MKRLRILIGLVLIASVLALLSRRFTQEAINANKSPVAFELAEEVLPYSRKPDSSPLRLPNSASTLDLDGMGLTTNADFIVRGRADPLGPRRSRMKQSPAGRPFPGDL